MCVCLYVVVFFFFLLLFFFFFCFFFHGIILKIFTNLQNDFLLSEGIFKYLHMTVFTQIIWTAMSQSIPYGPRQNCSQLELFN